MKMDTLSTDWKQGILGIHLNFPPSSAGLIWKQALGDIKLEGRQDYCKNVHGTWWFLKILA